MKKNLYKLLLLCGALSVFAACQKDDDSIIFKASVEDYVGGAAAKFHVEGGYASWDSGDQLRVNSFTGTVSVDRSSGTATITGVSKNSSNKYYSVSPLACVGSGPVASSNTFGTIVFPQNQTYTTTSEGFQKVESPMVAACLASSDATVSLQFQNVGSLIKVVTPSTVKVDKIVVRAMDAGNNFVNICGTGAITNESSVSNADWHPTFALQSNMGKVITLDCSAADASVTDFYVVVPPLQNVKFVVDVYYLGTGSNICFSYKLQKSQSAIGSLPRSEMGVVPFSTASEYVQETPAAFEGYGLTWSNSITSDQKSIILQLFRNMVMVKGKSGISFDVVLAGTGATTWTNVTLSDYFIDKYEITKNEWYKVMGSIPAGASGNWNNLIVPAAYVCYNDANSLLAVLNGLVTIEGKSFNLPTECQWRFAANEGQTSNSNVYSGGNTASTVAWYLGNSGSSLKDVGTKAANALGLHDMTGNVWEWCLDGYKQNGFNPTGKTDPYNPTPGGDGFYVILGGSGETSDGSSLYLTHRRGKLPTSNDKWNGLRIVIS